MSVPGCKSCWGARNVARHSFFSQAWQQTAESSSDPSEDKPVFCPAGQLFTEWASQYCQPLIEEQTPEALNQAKIRLFDKYWEMRGFLSSSHRRTAHRGGDLICVEEVWEEYAQRIRLAWLKAAPAVYHLPPPPKKPKKVKHEPEIPDYPAVGELIDAGQG
jgi:hypothetical protein